MESMPIKCQCDTHTEYLRKLKIEETKNPSYSNLGFALIQTNIMQTIFFG